MKKILVVDMPVLINDNIMYTLNKFDIDNIKTKDFTPDREHGWYNKFNKQNKKK